MSIEDEGERDRVWTDVDGGKRARLDVKRTGVCMEDGGERDWVWTGVDKGGDGR